MEKPYKGRAIVSDTLNGVQVSIPSKKNWLVILFVGAWLGGWLMGELFALGALIGGFGEVYVARIFLLFWLCAWSVGGFFAFRTFLWNLLGKEIIPIGRGQLTIRKRGLIFFSPRTYDLREVKSMRVQDDDFGAHGFFGGRRNDPGAMNSGGTIRFDYGLRTVKFAGAMEEAEAKAILMMLRAKNALSDKNFEDAG